MRSYKDGQNFIVILKKGEKLTEGLREFVNETFIKTAWLQGQGAVLEAEIGYYNLATQKYQWKTLTGPLEITNLQGNIAQKNSEPVFHLHGSFSREDYSVVGGHVKDLTIAGTCELLVQSGNYDLVRRLDNEVGLQLLYHSAESVD